MVLTVLVNKRFVFIRVIRGQKINAVVLTFLRRCRAVCTPLFLLIIVLYFLFLQFTSLYKAQLVSVLLRDRFPSSIQLPGSKYSAPTQPLGIPK
jgi:hypothetical protein